MKDSGTITQNMEKVTNNFKMELSMRDLLLRVNHKAMAHIHGTMDKPMKDNGSME